MNVHNLPFIIFLILNLLSPLSAHISGISCGNPTSIQINSDFQNCQMVSGTTSNGSSILGEPTQPDCLNGNPSRSGVWYQPYTLTGVEYPEGFTAILSNFSGTGAIGMNIYSGSCFSGPLDPSLHNIDCAYSSNGQQLTVVSDAFDGSPYYLYIWSEGDNPVNHGTFDLCVYGNLSTSPSNNTCGTSEVIFEFDCAEPPCPSTAGTTVEATASYDGDCVVNSSEVSDVWYQLSGEDFPYGINIHVNKFSGTGGIGVALIFVPESTCGASQINIACAFSPTGEDITLTVSQAIDASPSTSSSYRLVVWSEGGIMDQGVFEVWYRKNFSPPENCSNNIDDDQDGAIDCDDTDCGKPFLTQAATVVHPTCPSNTNGSITIHAGGANLRYNINNIGWVTSNTFTGLSPGGPYTIMIENAATGCFITETINLNGGDCPNPTGGDDCGQAPLIIVNAASAGCANVVSANYTGATSSSGTNGIPCYNGSFHDNDIWFQFIAPASGAVSFHHAYLPHGSYGVAVYTDCAASSYLQCDHARLTSTLSGFSPPTATFTGLSPQSPYYLRVWDNDFNQTNPQFEFCLLEVGSPVNDLCVDAIEISCGNTYTGHNINGTSSLLLENVPTGNFCEEVTFNDNPGVWYKMTGTGTAITLDLCSSNDLLTNYNAEISVLVGNCTDGFSCVKGVTGEASCFNQPTLTFNSTDNQLYYIYINGFTDGDEGVFELSVTCEALQVPTCAVILGPPDNATDTPQDMVVAWDIVANATHYLTYIGTDGNGTSLPTNIMNGRASGNKFDTSDTLSNLALATTYYWSVMPVNGAGSASNCPILSFTTSATVIETCPPAIQTATTRTQFPPEILTAENTIESTDTVEANAGILYIAGQSITLKAGFHAKAGADFFAMVIANACGIPPLPLTADLPSKMIKSNSLSTITDLVVFPNPFSNSTTIQLDLPASSSTQLSLFDFKGRLVNTLLPLQQLEAGPYQFNFENHNLPAGMYFLKLQTTEGQRMRKVIITRY